MWLCCAAPLEGSSAGMGRIYEARCWSEVEACLFGAGARHIAKRPGTPKIRTPQARTRAVRIPKILPALAVLCC